MSNYEKLKELAEATKGWDNLKSCWPEETEDGDLEVNWFVGAVTADDDKYPVLEVNTAQYDALEDAGRLARYYAAANPSAVLALIAENERLQGCEDVLRQLASHVGAGGYNAPEVDPETFARKIMDGINILNDPMAQLVIKKGEQIDQLRAEVAGLRTGYEAYERVNAELKAEVELLRSLLGQSALAATTLRTDAEAYANHSGFNRVFVDLIRSISGVEVGHGYGSSKYPQQADVVAALGQGEQS